MGSVGVVPDFVTKVIEANATLRDKIAQLRLQINTLNTKFDDVKLHNDELEKVIGQLVDSLVQKQSCNIVNDSKNISSKSSDETKQEDCHKAHKRKSKKSHHKDKKKSKSDFETPPSKPKSCSFALDSTKDKSDHSNPAKIYQSTPKPICNAFPKLISYYVDPTQPENTEMENSEIGAEIVLEDISIIEENKMNIYNDHIQDINPFEKVRESTPETCMPTIVLQIPPSSPTKIDEKNMHDQTIPCATPDKHNKKEVDRENHIEYVQEPDVDSKKLNNRDLEPLTEPVKIFDFWSEDALIETENFNNFETNQSKQSIHGENDMESMHFHTEGNITSAKKLDKNEDLAPSLTENHLKSLNFQEEKPLAIPENIEETPKTSSVNTFNITVRRRRSKIIKG